MPSSTESTFVGVALRVAKTILHPPLTVDRGQPLLYELKVSDALEVMQPAQIKQPRRGSSAFETDFCVFEEVDGGVRIPRVVIEFKTGIGTHDVLTYSAKAERHKRIYPYLRYGMLASSEKAVPGRAFTHNESLDFLFAAGGLSEQGFAAEFAPLLESEVRASRLLQAIAYGKVKARIFRAEPAMHPSAA